MTAVDTIRDAIYESPNDRTLWAIFADVLANEGDPKEAFWRWAVENGDKLLLEFIDSGWRKGEWIWDHPDDLYMSEWHKDFPPTSVENAFARLKAAWRVMKE